MTSVPTSNLAAYDFYLRSKEYIDRYLHSRNIRDFENALHLLREALNLDPEFALAYAYMGLVYQWNFPTNWIKNGFSIYAEPKCLDSVFFFSHKALSLDPDLAEGYWVRSWYYATKGENEKSITDLKHAIALNPAHDFYKGLGLFYAEMGEYGEAFTAYKESFALVQHYRTIDYADVGNFYMHIGELAKAKLYYQESIKLQPDFGWGYWNLSWLAVIQGRFEDALPFSEKVLSLYPDDHDNYLNVASILALLKRFSEAEENLRKGISKLDQRGIDSHREGGYILWMNGKKGEAMERFNKLIDYCKECIRIENRYGQKRASYDLAGTYAFLGNKQEAYKWLRDYEKRGFKSGLENYILADPLFASLREEKEFKEIIKRVQNQKSSIRKEVKKLERSGALLR